MLILGLESSCDETAAAIVADGLEVIANEVASQHELHEEYGGVVPEIASRAHVERLMPTLRRALDAAGCRLDQVDAVAVGHRPGLIGALLVGVAAAKALAWSLRVPLIGVDHVHAHLYAGFLRERKSTVPKGTPLDIEGAYPALGLVVSGGHTSMYLCRSPVHLERLGATIDDAVGEAYDKVAAILGLGHPGGPRVDELARTGNDRAVDLPISRLGPGSLDFSFSGLKTAVLYSARGFPGQEQPPPVMTDARRADLCASFQRAACAAVILKLERALDLLASRAEPVRTLLVGGGVSANSRLRTELTALAPKRSLALSLPAMAFCVDNAAMIAGLGFQRLKAGLTDPLTLEAEPTTAL